MLKVENFASVDTSVPGSQYLAIAKQNLEELSTGHSSRQDATGRGFLGMSPGMKAASPQSSNPPYNGPRFSSGKPFLAYRQPAGQLFTDNGPSAYVESNYRRMANTPLNNEFSRQFMTDAAMNLSDRQGNLRMAQLQTFTNPSGLRGCSTDDDCTNLYGKDYECNGSFEEWDEAHGMQGNYCSRVIYPELGPDVTKSTAGKSRYSRALTEQKGIGRACTADGDCASGYSCQTEFDLFGRGLQDGYCAKPYSCGDGKTRYLKYSNSGLPFVPPKEQNKYGKGFSTFEECKANASATQDCVQDSSGKFFGTYRAECPIGNDFRAGGSVDGNVIASTAAEAAGTSYLPGWEPGGTSSAGGVRDDPKAFSGFNMTGSSILAPGTVGVQKFLNSPRPPNQIPK